MSLIEFDRAKFYNWVKENTEYERLSLEIKDAFQNWSVHDSRNVFDNMHKVIKVCDQVVVIIERFSKDIEKLSSSDKLDLAVDFIDDCIKLPLFLEWADQIVIKHVITTIVLQYNRWFSKKWLEAMNVKRG
jgi:hypothetical protein